jgi:hypothetical protein
MNARIEGDGAETKSINENCRDANQLERDSIIMIARMRRRRRRRSTGNTNCKVKKLDGKLKNILGTFDTEHK